MGVLSLRLVAAIICVLLTFATALVTLTLSMTFTQKAVDNIGLQHTDALLRNLQGTLQTYFQGAVDDYMGVAQVAAGRNDDFPNNTWAGGFAVTPTNWNLWPQQSLPLFDWQFDSMTAIITATNYTRDAVSLMCFGDGSLIQSAYQVNNSGIGYVSLLAGRGKVTATSNTLMYYRYFSQANRQPLANWPPLYTSSAIECRIRPYYLAAPRTPFKCFWLPPYVSTVPTSTVTGVYCTLYNVNGQFLGVAGNTMSLASITTFVRQLSRIAGSDAFVIDRTTFSILGSTYAAPFQSSTPYNASLLVGGVYTGPLNKGCLAGALATNTMIICQTAVDDYPYAPLRAVKGKIGASATPVSGLIENDGMTYYYSTASVYTYDSTDVATRTPLTGLDLAVVIIIPEDAITGEVTKGRTYSIIGAVVLFVVSSAASFVAFTLFLRPLDRLQEQMEETASLQDSSEKEDISALSEIGSMQKAFYTMRAQLKKIKSYVPQSVLATLVDAGEDEDDPHFDGRPSHHSAISGRPSRVSTDAAHRSHRSGEGGTTQTRNSDSTGGSRTLNLSVAITKRKITVLAFNVRSFHGYVDSNGGDAVAASLSRLVESVSHSVSQYRGIVDSFHGDHIIATFNAVNNNPQHAVRAGITALDIIHQIKSNPAMASRFPHVTIGIATGEAIVGNMGTDSLKRFCSIGPVYTQALVLERLAKQYAPHEVLISNASAVEMQYEFYYEVLDVVPLPGSTRPTLVAALVGRKAFDANRDSEWMYTMQKGNDGDAFGVTNAAFLKYVSDDAAGAQTFLATIPADDSRLLHHGYRNLTGMLHTPLATHVTRQGTYYTSSFLPGACPLE